MRFLIILAIFLIPTLSYAEGAGFTSTSQEAKFKKDLVKHLSERLTIYLKNRLGEVPHCNIPYEATLSTDNRGLISAVWLNRATVWPQFDKFFILTIEDFVARQESYFDAELSRNSEIKLNIPLHFGRTCSSDDIFLDRSRADVRARQKSLGREDMYLGCKLSGSKSRPLTNSFEKLHGLDAAVHVTKIVKLQKTVFTVEAIVRKDNEIILQLDIDGVERETPINRFAFERNDTYKKINVYNDLRDLATEYEYLTFNLEGLNKISFEQRYDDFFEKDRTLFLDGVCEDIDVQDYRSLAGGHNKNLEGELSGVPVQKQKTDELPLIESMNHNDFDVLPLTELQPFEDVASCRTKDGKYWSGGVNSILDGNYFEFAQMDAMKLTGVLSSYSFGETLGQLIKFNGQHYEFISINDNQFSRELNVIDGNFEAASGNFHLFLDGGRHLSMSSKQTYEDGCEPGGARADMDWCYAATSYLTTLSLELNGINHSLTSELYCHGD